MRSGGLSAVDDFDKRLFWGFVIFALWLVISLIVIYVLTMYSNVQVY